MLRPYETLPKRFPPGLSHHSIVPSVQPASQSNLNQSGHPVAASARRCPGSAWRPRRGSSGSESYLSFHQYGRDASLRGVCLFEGNQREESSPHHCLAWRRWQSDGFLARCGFGFGGRRRIHPRWCDGLQLYGFIRHASRRTRWSWWARWSCQYNTGSRHKSIGARVSAGKTWRSARIGWNSGN